MTERFKCQKCGVCCEKLLIFNKDKIIIGLTLTPEECKLFDDYKDSIYPDMGYKEPSGKIIISSYKLLIPSCPHYNKVNKKCEIYDKRPRVCREYPFINKKCDKLCNNYQENIKQPKNHKYIDKTINAPQNSIIMIYVNIYDKWAYFVNEYNCMENIKFRESQNAIHRIINNYGFENVKMLCDNLGMIDGWKFLYKLDDEKQRKLNEI